MSNPRKFLTGIDLAQNPINNAQIQNLASAPGSPVTGQMYFDTTLHEFGVYSGSAWTYLGTGGGTVTTVSVASANGFAGTVANATSTPAITITTTVSSGMVKSTGTALSAATAGTDYAAATTGSSSLKGNGSGGFAAATLNDNATPTADYSMGGFKLTNVATPVSTTDAANKAYVDSVAQGLNVKPSARVATVGTETYTVTSGSVATINGLTIDGVTMAIGDRILIKDAPASSGTGSPNSTQPGNGVYAVTANTTNLTVARATDMAGTNAPQGAFVFVEAGTANNASGYTVSTPSAAGAFTYGTNNIAFTQFSGAGELVAGTGLSKSGNTLSLTTPVAAANGGAGTINGILKANGSGVVSLAASGTDYAPATSGSSVLKGNGSGGTTAATGGTDYVRPFFATIGNASSTSIAVTHSLSNQFPIAQVHDASSDAVVECDIVFTSTSVTTFNFAVAPTTNQFAVVIIG